MTEGMYRLIQQSFLGYMGAGEGGGTKGRCLMSRDARAGEALACCFWARCRDGGDGRGIMGMGFQGRKKWEG